jgi:hypothetical protein
VKTPFYLGCLTEPWVLQLSYDTTIGALAACCAVAIAAAVIEARRRDFRWLPLYGGFLALHPGWRLMWRELRDGTRSIDSDCGYGSRFTSFAVLIATVWVLVILYRRSTLSRRSFVFRGAVAFTTSHIAYLVYVFWPTRKTFLPSWCHSTWCSEAFESVTGGFGGLPQHMLGLIAKCVGLYIIQRLRFPNAV